MAKQVFVIRCAKGTVANRAEIEKTITDLGAVPLFIEYTATAPHPPMVETHVIEREK